MDITDLNLIIFKNYIKPDIDKKNHFLYNTENSMKVFDNIKNDIFTFEETLLKVENKKKIDTYIIKSSDINTSCTNNNYKECLILGKQFEETTSLTIEIIKKTQNKTLKNEDIKTSILLSFVIDIKIPIFIGNEGILYSNNNNYLPNSLEIGGFFVTKNVIKKFVVFKEDRVYTWPKYNLIKTNVYHVSFNSLPFRFMNRLDKPQYLIVNIDMNLNKLSLEISSNKTLPKYNILILICFLTKLSLKIIKNILISRFINIQTNEVYDGKIIDMINILFDTTYNELHTYKNENEEFNEYLLIDVYIKKNFTLYYYKNFPNDIEAESQVREYYQTFYKNLLPIVNSMVLLLDENNTIKMSNSEILKIKGYTLLGIFEDMLIASYQNQVYPEKYDLSNRRLASPGNTFEVISIELVKNLINDFKDQINKQIKNKTKLDNNLSIKPYRKIQNVFNNIFNMQDKKHSLIIKPQKNTNAAQKIITNNLIVWDTYINLSKYMNIRNPSTDTYHYMGPIDTPDHGKKVAINRRLNTGTRINDKDFETHKKIILEIYNFVKYYLKHNSEINNNLVEDVVNIFLVDDSELWIGMIEQNKIKELYDILLEKKRQNIFETNLIDIALIPYYTQTKLKLLLPIKKFRKLRINIGNKIPFMPAYLVKNGIVVMETIKFDETSEELRSMTFNEIIQKYDIIEYIGPEQFTYVNICENLTTFINLSLESRKKYDYVSFDNSLNLSMLESMIFDISKMPGARGIFSASQLKNSISSIQPDSLNTIEASKFTISGYQEPCITTDILRESKIARQSFGAHVLVAYTAYNDNIDDSIIINKNSVNNGLFIIINTLLYKGEIEFKNLQNTNQNIQKIKNSYKKLDDDSIPKLNTVLELGDALYGNVEAKLKKTNNIFYLQDNSIPYKFLIPGRVDRILVSSNETYKNIRYTVAVCHYAERGHKIGNQCAQKATISKLADPQELLYTKDGIRPDIILNSLSKLNRKTINMFYQTMVTNYYNYIPLGENNKKQFINYNSFSNNNIITLQNYKTKLKKHYPEYSDSKINEIFHSEELMFDPYTGEPLKYKIFIGPIYFTRLAQISDEKISARNRGKLNKLNQPPAGKQKGGSHRLGEMEIDLLATHGCSNMLYEISNDSLEVQNFVLICKNCTSIATKVKNNNQISYTCLNCDNIKIVPILEKHILNKSTKVLIGLLNFRGVKINIHYNQIPILYSSQI